MLRPSPIPHCVWDDFHDRFRELRNHHGQFRSDGVDIRNGLEERRDYCFRSRRFILTFDSVVYNGFKFIEGKLIFVDFGILTDKCQILDKVRNLEVTMLFVRLKWNSEGIIEECGRHWQVQQNCAPLQNGGRSDLWRSAKLRFFEAVWLTHLKV